MKTTSLFLLLSVFFFTACKNNHVFDNNFAAVDTLVKPENFQKTIDGKEVKLYTLKNDSGLVVKITNYGARIVSILAPDKNGKYADIVLGYASIDDYLKDNMFLGCAVGRYANRIGDAKFKINNKEYHLAPNDNGNTLHGGIKGFDKKVWDAIQHGDTLELTYVSADMEEGFPGNLTTKVWYIITNNNELVIKYEATTDKTTILNLTNHSYFNLQGEGSNTILDHYLQIMASQTSEVNNELIPTGKIIPVDNTPFDFRSPHLIGERINADNEQLINGKGYDHNWILDKQNSDLTLAIRLSDSISGRVLELYTTEPGIQVYTGNFMDGSVKGKSGKPYKYRAAIAMEPQHFPDSPNHSNFPSTLLNPEEKYTQTSIFKVLINK